MSTVAESKRSAQPSVSDDFPGAYREKDVPWCSKKVAIFKALKALKATSFQSAKTAKVVAKKAKVAPRDVAHYCYHARAAGLVALDRQEGVKGYVFWLTIKGAKVDPIKVLKDQQAKKVS